MIIKVIKGMIIKMIEDSMIEVTMIKIKVYAQLDNYFHYKKI